MQNIHTKVGFKTMKHINELNLNHAFIVNDIAIDGLCDNVVSYCQYDCYYNINLKGA